MRLLLQNIVGAVHWFTDTVYSVSHVACLTSYKDGRSTYASRLLATHSPSSDVARHCCLAMKPHPSHKGLSLNEC